MPSTKTQPARGMRDFLPADVRKREYVIGVIKQVYERYGFEPLETPAVENIETLLGKYGEEGNQLIFKILKRGLPSLIPESQASKLSDLGLRYDLTVPLARVMALYQDSKLPKFFKRYQIQPVWRAERHQKGRFREFYQCDVDVVGSRSMVVEAELIAAASDALVALGFNDFTIRLNHRQLIDAMMAASMIEESKRASVIVTIDKMDKLGMENVEKELALLGLSENKIRPLLNRLTKTTFIDSQLKIHEFSQDPYEANLEHLDFIVRSFKDFSYGDEGKVLSNKAVDELTKIVNFAQNTSAGRYLKVDPSLARGLSYYTGAIMEIEVPDLSGSLGGGGRYDSLVGMFSKRDVPACGFSLGLERILVVMGERNMFPPALDKSSADVLIGILDEGSVRTSLGLAGELRRFAKVDVYPEYEHNIGVISSYAKKRGIRLMIIIGSKERETNQVTLQDLDLFQREAWPIQQIERVVREKLTAPTEHDG